jgi:hypothetical protein
MASTSGAGPLGLTWTAQPGNWSLVVMNAGVTTGVSTRLDFGATAPDLRPVAIAMLGVGLVLLAFDTVLVARHRSTPAREPMTEAGALGAAIIAVISIWISAPGMLAGG